MQRFGRKFLLVFRICLHPASDGSCFIYRIEFGPGESVLRSGVERRGANWLDKDQRLG